MNPGKTSIFLYLIAKMRPEVGTPSSRALKGFSAELPNKAVAEKLTGIEKTLVGFSAQKLAADFDDDNWCGTPYPGKHGPAGPLASFEDVMLNPQPLPPKELEREIGGYLMMLSEATS